MFQLHGFHDELFTSAGRLFAHMHPRVMDKANGSAHRFNGLEGTCQLAKEVCGVGSINGRQTTILWSCCTSPTLSPTLPIDLSRTSNLQSQRAYCRIRVCSRRAENRPFSAVRCVRDVMGLVEYDSDTSSDDAAGRQTSTGFAYQVTTEGCPSRLQDASQISRKRRHVKMQDGEHGDGGGLEDDRLRISGASLDAEQRSSQRSSMKPAGANGRARSKSLDQPGALFGTNPINAATASQTPAREDTYDYAFRDEPQQRLHGDDALQAGGSTTTSLALGSIEKDQRLRGMEIPRDAKIHDYDVDTIAKGQDAQGDAASPSRVRFISGGRHRLSSLLNAAVGQNDALVEQFARDKRKKSDSARRSGF